jgi:type I restriction enzyme S subunit
MTEWQVKKIGDIADTQLGKMLNKGKQSGKHTKPYLRTDNVHWGRLDLSEIKEMDILPEEQDKYLARKGDLLMCEGGASGRTAIWNEDYPISFQNHIHRIRPKDPNEISPKYLLYYFEWFIKNGFANDLIKGVTISSLSQSGLRSIEVTYPHIDEQHKIVELLEDHLSRLDAALADVSQGQKKIRQFRRSFLQETFIEGQGSRPCNLGDVVEIKTGKIDANRAVPNGKYPFFTCAREISRIDDAPFNGKVVLVAGNGDLNVKYYEGKFNAYQRTYILRSKSEEILFPKYLFWFMEHYIFELRTLAIGTTIKYIKLGNLMDAKISLPPVNIQKQVVLDIESSLSFVEKSEETFGKLTRESRSLRRAILNSAFSGKLTNEVLHV